MGSRPPAGKKGAIDKALAVLEALAGHDRLADIAAATGLPKSTVHRILQTLIGHGFAVSGGAGEYRPGPRVLTLAGQVMARWDPAQAATPLLRALHDRTGLTVHLAMLAGDEAVYVEKIEGRLPYQLASRVGMPLRLHCTAIGKAILAALAEEEARVILDRAGMERHTPRTVTDPDTLLAQLRQIRARGFAVDDEENEPGVRCVGAAVRDHLGRVTGAVGVSMLVFERTLEEAEALGPLVVETAEAVSRALCRRAASRR
ncbi:hypothetical protein TH66_07635 [Carbonactinospora thermoautotrophica]|nr:IclR family transcriptional regulator [Carbonactinospora thermoautotrophica]KWX04559.1 hypothetical protein TH66_07635 [Carbonactinospora thermoautotrophica]KWX06431.1 hypothetical protein TR74_22105 [Carbonactinospora thermoautotrophica]